MNSFIKKIDHFVITTSNIEKCLTFYQRLGFEVVDSMGRYELFVKDFKINVHLLNHELQPHARNIECGSADVCFEIDTDITQLHQSLLQENFDLESDIVIRHGVRGSMHSIYLYDPDGNLLEFCKYDK